MSREDDRARLLARRERDGDGGKGFDGRNSLWLWCSSDGLMVVESTPIVSEPVYRLKRR